jgi:hypothetical protein
VQASGYYFFVIDVVSLTSATARWFTFIDWDISPRDWTEVICAAQQVIASGVREWLIVAREQAVRHAGASPI